jgi:hypothetical protein
MAANVGQLTTDELREIIGSVVEEKLKEVLGDPDDGLNLAASVQERLEKQKREVANGERGEDLDVIGQQIFDAWRRGEAPRQIAEEIGLPIKLVYDRLKQQQKTYIASPRLTHPEQTKDFELQVIEDPHADV